MADPTFVASIILGGGAGTHLFPLTSRRAKPADTVVRRPANPEEELRWMSQEVRGYVEDVLNSIAANVPKAVLCQVEKAKEDMLNKLYIFVRLEFMELKGKCDDIHALRDLKSVALLSTR